MAIEDMIIAVSPDEKIVFANKAVSSKVGYTWDELRQMRAMDLHPPEKRHEAEKILAEMVRGERNICPLPLQKKNGDYIPVETRGWTGKWSGKDCLFAICKDISREQQALQKFDRMFNFNPAPTAVNSIPEMKFTDVNNAFLSLLGLSRNEVIGRTPLELGLFVESNVHEQVAKILFDNGSIRNVELKLKKKDGSIIDGLFFGEVIENQGEKSFLTLMVDITQIKRATRALKESEKRFRDLAESLPQIVFEIDAKGKFLFVNSAAQNLTGYSTEEFLADLTPQELVVPGDRKRISETMLEIFKGRHNHDKIFTALKKDGSTFPIVVYSAQLFSRASLVGIRGIIVDVSDLMKAQREKEELKNRLFQSQKMQTLGTLVGGIAHDFNNMLQIMIGYAEILLVDKKPSEQGYKALQTIIQTGRDGAELVRKLLAFSQRNPIVRSYINLNDQIKDLLPVLSRNLPPNVRIEMSLTDEPTVMLGDRSQIDQVLSNLVINAAEAMPDGGHLHIETKLVSFDESYCRCHIGAKLGKHVMLCVRDDGLGISAEVLEKIFDPFFTTKQRGASRGTGLGLSVVKGIVEQHGGHVTCESEPGSGTEFRVFFPYLDVTS